MCSSRIRGMSEAPLEVASRLFAQAVAVLREAAGPGASEAELLGVLTVAEGVRRGLDQVGVAALADLERRGTFGERGYRSSAAALGDRSEERRVGKEWRARS